MNRNSLNEDIKLYPEMNENIVDLLNMTELPLCQYAAAYIRNLENQIEEIGGKAYEAE